MRAVTNTIVSTLRKFQYIFSTLLRVRKTKTPLEAYLEGFSEVPSGGLKADLIEKNFRHF